MLRTLARSVLPTPIYQGLRHAYLRDVLWPARADRRPECVIVNRERAPALMACLDTCSLAPTALCRVMTWFGSDKASERHSYTPIYAALLAGRESDPLRLFELGIGRMWGGHLPGASLRAWDTYLPHASIYGADIDPTILFTTARIQTHVCDQLDRVSIRALWTAFPDRFDVIIDDGIHTFDGSLTFLEESLSRLAPGGFYAIEDIAHEAIPHWHAWMAAHQEHACAFLTMPLPANRSDNHLLIIAG